MADIGRELAQARQRAALSLQDMARRTKISPPILDALERSDFKSLPGGLYTRGLLRAYAREVGLDAEDIVRRFRESGDGRLIEHDVTIEEIAHAAERPKPGARPVPPDTTDSDRRREISQLAILALALLVGGVAYAGFGGAFRSLMRHAPPAAAIPPIAAPPSQQPPSAQTPPPQAMPLQAAASTPATAPSEAPQPPPPPQPRQTLPPEEHPTAIETAGVSQTVAAAPADHEAGPLRLEIQATGPCWVTGTADGERIIYQLLNAGDRTQIDANEDVVLRVGDPGVLAYTINGSTGRSLGSSGEPVTIHLTRQNYREFVGP